MIESTVFFDLIDAFQSCSLDELEDGYLMNRVDTKFLLEIEKLPALLNALKPEYHVLEVAGKRCLKYENVYYDTSDFHFYHMHHQGRLNRYKVRVRNYVDADERFLEVKFKNNKKRTIKTRTGLPKDYDRGLSSYYQFLKQARVPQVKNLQVCQRSSYTRIALINHSLKEKLSIDTGMVFQPLIKGAAGEYRIDNLAIVELKQPRIDRHSPAYEFMRRYGVRPSNFSKYCMGLMLSTEEQALVRYNRFKPVSRKLKNN